MFYSSDVRKIQEVLRMELHKEELPLLESSETDVDGRFLSITEKIDWNLLN